MLKHLVYLENKFLRRDEQRLLSRFKGIVTSRPTQRFFHSPIHVAQKHYSHYRNTSQRLSSNSYRGFDAELCPKSFKNNQTLPAKSFSKVKM